MNALIRKRLCFYGQVQGVGFRYRARYAASRYGATGWARNEYDGSVTMEIQGTREAIDQVLQAIARGTFVEIERMEERQIPVVPEESWFHAE